MTASAALIAYAEQHLLDLHKSASWRSYERWTRRYRNAVERKMRSFFLQQQKEAIASIEAGKSMVKAPEQWLDWGKWQIIFEEYGQLFLPEVIGDKGQLEMEKLLIGVDFEIENPRVSAFIANRKFRFSFDTNKKTREDLRAAFQEAILAGEGVPDMTKRVNEVFGFAKKHRAERIARSEIIRASNYGAEQAYLQSGVVAEKEWIVSRDERLCPYCEPMKGRRVVVGMVFFQRGDVLENPDPESTATLKLDYEDIFHPPLHPQCRCTLSPVLAT
jgi:SPP1 gp7 family putative phage head morphogenesis protein